MTEEPDTGPVGPEQTQEGRRLLAAATKRPWRWDGAFGRDEEWSSNGPDLMSGDGVVLGAWGHDAWGVDVHEDDAALIVAAVNQYSLLLDDSDELQDIREQLAELTEDRTASDPDDEWHRGFHEAVRRLRAALPPSRDSTPDPLE